jgi:hypothetical protein
MRVSASAEQLRRGCANGAPRMAPHRHLELLGAFFVRGRSSSRASAHDPSLIERVEVEKRRIVWATLSGRR